MRRFLGPVAGELEAPELKMRIDVSEKDDAYLVKADIPGVKKEDINVRIDGNVVQIDAEVKREKETKGNGDKVLRSALPALSLLSVSRLTSASICTTLPSMRTLMSSFFTPGMSALTS